MSYQLYRNTTLGNTLQESLDELIQVKLSYQKNFYSACIFSFKKKLPDY